MFDFAYSWCRFAGKVGSDQTWVQFVHNLSSPVSLGAHVLRDFMETGSVHMLALTVWLCGYRFPTRWEKLQNRAVLGIEGLYVVQTLVNRVGETVSVEGIILWVIDGVDRGQQRAELVSL